MSTKPELDWTELDDQAVDTVRVLAMDAVQKVGNGHPGTAMSLAPAAYLLFQKVMRHNPADPHWPGRDRFVLSCGHSTLTLYLQLYLGGWGLELEDIKSLRTWGSKTPGHPEYGHTAGVETTTGPLGQGIGNAVGMAMAARRERGLLDPNAAEGASPFDHHIYAICSDGDIEEGVSARPRPSPAPSELGNLTLIYDANQISIEDNTDIAFNEDVGARYEAYGWHVQTVDWTHGGTEYLEDVPALYAAIQAAEAVTDRPSFIVLARSSPGRLRTPRTPARRTARRSATTRSPRPRRSSASTPTRPSRSPPDVSRTPAQLVERGKAAQAAWDERVRRWAPSRRRRAALFERLQTRHPARRLGRRLPTFDADPEGVATRKASGAAINAIAAGAARALGRLGRPGRVQQHHDRERAVLHARRPRDQDVAGRPATPGACSTSASASTPWARSSTASRCTPAPVSSAGPS